MSRPFWKLTVRPRFRAAYVLWHYQGKCEHLHDHNYAVEAAVRGYTLSQNTELLMGLGDLKAPLEQALEPLDHAYINDVPPFGAVNPSSENLVRYIWNQMAPSLPEVVKMYSATVAGKDIQSVMHMEEE